MIYKHLKSGTDIRGKAIGQDAILNESTAEKIGYSFVKWLQSKGEKDVRIAIGRDSRLSGEKLLNACAVGMAKAGAQVQRFGLCTTPAMYQSLQHQDLALTASIMVTASHHPSNRNGFKFFTKEQGSISSQMLSEILAVMEHIDVSETNSNLPNIVDYPYLDHYRKHIANIVREKLDTDVNCPLLGLHVVVDAGNGAGGFYEKLMKDLGAWTEGSQFLEPDGSFPHHMPNPEDPTAMAAISETVKRVGADIGVIFDADCDRAAIVDGSGKEINRNRLIALVSAVLLDKEPGITVVTDSVTSSGLSKFIGEWGGIHYRYKRGYRNVIDEALRLNQSGINCPLAMETSGHAAFRENDFIDDGMYLSTLLICEALRKKQEGKSLFSMIDGLEEPIESLEARLNIKASDFHAAGLRVIEKVMDHASFNDEWTIAPDNREGIRISLNLDGGMDNAWFLLRLSVHDPVLPLNIESDVEGGVSHIVKQLYALLKDIPDVSLQPLIDYLQIQA